MVLLEVLHGRRGPLETPSYFREVSNLWTPTFTRNSRWCQDQVSGPSVRDLFGVCKGPLYGLSDLKLGSQVRSTLKVLAILLFLVGQSNDSPGCCIFRFDRPNRFTMFWNCVKEYRVFVSRLSFARVWSMPAYIYIYIYATLLCNRSRRKC